MICPWLKAKFAYTSGYEYYGNYGVKYAYCDADYEQYFTPFVPGSLRFLKVFDAVPFFALPSPFPAFNAQHDCPDETENKGDKSQPHLIANSPYPGQGEATPAPPFEFGGEVRKQSPGRNR